MNDNTGGMRYMSQVQISSFYKGAIHYGLDVSLNRRVLMYTSEALSEKPREDRMLKLSRAASFQHEGFLHILDTCYHEHAMQIILQFKQGKLLLDEIRKTVWTLPAVIRLAADLGVSMLDALEERITGFSVGADNVWLGEDGRVSVINYWDEGETHTQGAVGLCGLMIQLLAGGKQVSDPYESLHTILERLHIKETAPGQQQELVKLVKRVCLGQASLSTLVFGLQSLSAAAASNSEKRLEASPVFSVPPRKRAETPPAAASRETEEDEEDEEDYEDIAEETSSRPYKQIGLGALGLIVVLCIVWALWPSPEESKQASVTPSVTAQPTPTASAEAQESEAPAETDAKEASVEETQEVNIPNLVGMTLEDAEKQALENGLHYNYLLEMNDQAEGTVFKQEPESGAPAIKGDSITFWVSKGSQP